MSKKIGVLVSSGYGAGWSTWGDPNSALDQELVAAIERNAPSEELERIADKNWPDQYKGGLYDCHVVWLDEGTLFRIDEYDGSESITLADEQEWQIAKNTKGE